MKIKKTIKVTATNTELAIIQGFIDLFEKMDNDTWYELNDRVDFLLADMLANVKELYNLIERDNGDD